MKKYIHKQITRNEEACYKKNMKTSWVEVKKQHNEIVTVPKAPKQLTSKP